MEKLFQISNEEGLNEVKEMKEYYKIFGDKLPKELNEELNALEERYNKI
ncbi:MAG: phosphoenolpyruvate carboxykinase domain-containing protein [Ignavibacteria bacterium]